jgi:ABC-type nitrate/sulfonate/bicarbonate transport system substrate-binding protein
MRRDYLESHAAQADALCSAWQRATDEVSSSDSARQWIANRLGTSAAGFDSMLERIRLIGLPESRQWLSAPRPQLLATIARLQNGLLDAGLLPAPTPVEPLFRWPAALGASACRG